VPANENLAEFAKKADAAREGRRFVTSTEGTIFRTNGSLFCLVIPGVAKAGANFEEAALF
jgi:hypothetical protein